MHDDAVRHLAGHLGHERADSGQEHPRRAVFGVGGGEEGRHQRVAVEAAGEAQRLAMVPSRPDGAHGEDELAHARRRRRPRHVEAAGDVGADLRPQAEHEAAVRGGVQVVPQVREEHGRARERHGDAGDQVHPAGGLGGERQRQERVVRRLGGLNAAVAQRFQILRLGARGVQIPANAAIHLHVALLVLFGRSQRRAFYSVPARAAL